MYQMLLPFALWWLFGLHLQVQSQDHIVGTLQEGEAFHAKLVRAFASGDRKQVAALFAYPIRVQVTGLGQQVPVQNAQNLLALYDAFFSPEMRCSIEHSRKATPGNAPPSHPLLTADGVVSIDNGRLVATRTTNGFRVTRMVVTMEGPAPTRKPMVVSFIRKLSEVQYSGRLAHNDADVYVVSASAGDVLRASIDRFPGAALSLDVLQKDSGHALVVGNRSARMMWVPIPKSGDYRIEVRKRTPYCDPDVSYLLTVSRR